MEKPREEHRAETGVDNGPTVFPELNAVLQDLVTSTRAILAENFCAAYLQGSFALGEADEYSDVDFLIVTNDEVREAQLLDLQAMHKRLFALETAWAQHLEGSYAPRERFRQVDPSRSAFLFLDNGASNLVWDDHCNTAVVRWVLREHGIVLAGPDPESVIDPVPTEQLRREALNGIREFAAWAPEPTKAGPMSRWKQPYLVLTFCRMLHTLQNARVASKREAAAWALETLDPEWATLIRRALAERPDPWLRVYQPANPELVEQTLAFTDYVLQEAGAGR